MARLIIQGNRERIRRLSRHLKKEHPVSTRKMRVELKERTHGKKK